jgi:hypothetical protein
MLKEGGDADRQAIHGQWTTAEGRREKQLEANVVGGERGIYIYIYRERERKKERERERAADRNANNFEMNGNFDPHYRFLQRG